MNRRTERREAVRDTTKRTIFIVNSLSSTQRATKLRNTAAPLYKERYGVDPTELIIQEHMSDDASGPESDTEETHEEWMYRMADTYGFDTTTKSPTDLMQFAFREVIDCNWRADEVPRHITCTQKLIQTTAQLTCLIHKLVRILDETLTVKSSKLTQGTRVRGTGRSTNVPPVVAPYNFGINFQWLETYQNIYPVHLRDWGKYEDPEGFGSNAFHEDTNNRADNANGEDFSTDIEEVAEG